MNIYSIALKNITRRKAKTFLTLLSLMAAVMVLVAVLILLYSFRDSLDRDLDKLGYAVAVRPATADVVLSYGGMQITGVRSYEASGIAESDVERIKEIASQHNARISTKSVRQIMVQSKPALLVGTGIRQEFEIKPWWDYYGDRPVESFDVVAGSDAAKRLHLKPGSIFHVDKHTFNVTAILKETGSQDDTALFADEAAVKRVAVGKSMTSLVELAPRHSAEVASLVHEISATLPTVSVSTVQQALTYKQQAVAALSRFGLSVAGIIILISGIIVFMAVAASVMERKREIGIMRAIGYRGVAISKIILTETAILSIIAGMTGFALGIAAAYLIPATVTSLEITVTVRPLMALLAVFVSVMLGLLASYLPASRAAQTDPADAVKAL